jgi:hypothetical protein
MFRTSPQESRGEGGREGSSDTARPRAAEADPKTAEEPDSATEHETESFRQDAPPDREILAHHGGIDLLESPNYASHTHGGPPAELHRANLSFANVDGREHGISVHKVELLRSHCGEKTGWHSRKKLKIRSISLSSWNESSPISSHASKITVPAGQNTYRLSVAVDSFTVYQACDRFGFGLSLRVDGVDAQIELPLRVKRYEPMRR